MFNFTGNDKNAIASANFKGLNLNANFIANASEYFKDSHSKQFKDAGFTRSNVIYKGRELESVIFREAGHIVSDQKIGLINKWYANHDFVANGVLYKKCIMVERVMQKARETGDIFRISARAAKDISEFFAECFAIYKIGLEVLPDYIIKMIKEVIK